MDTTTWAQHLIAGTVPNEEAVTRNRYRVLTGSDTPLVMSCERYRLIDDPGFFQ